MYFSHHTCCIFWQGASSGAQRSRGASQAEAPGSAADMRCSSAKEAEGGQGHATIQSPPCKYTPLVHRTSKKSYTKVTANTAVFSVCVLFSLGRLLSHRGKVQIHYHTHKVQAWLETMYYLVNTVFLSFTTLLFIFLSGKFNYEIESSSDKVCGWTKYRRKNFKKLS